MKCKFYCAIGILVFLLSACGGHKDSPEYKSVPVEEMASDNNLENFDLALLASGIDTICGMSVSDGVADTLLVGDKIFGFCNTGCKNKFKSMIQNQ